jgi:carbon-monoxide dehydrogenase small subunit
VNIRFSLNGTDVAASVAADLMLVDLLRGLGATGTKEGCGVGVCGLCTVLVQERPVSSCIYLAPCIDGAQVWTIEGIAERDPAAPEAFARNQGLQCGICTPGQVVSAYALKREHPAASEEEIRAYMAGNLCRCTGYVSIMASVKDYLADD